VVVSPLIALMEDQVAALTARGISAAFLGSAQSSAEVGMQLACRKAFAHATATQRASACGMHGYMAAVCLQDSV
jgi:superfamily II DNA helicase RecQ